MPDMTHSGELGTPDGRVRPRVTLTFTDPAEMKELRGLIDSAVGHSDWTDSRRPMLLVLHRKIVAAQNRLEQKRQAKHSGSSEESAKGEG